MADNKISRIKLGNLIYSIRDNVSGYATKTYVDDQISAIKQFDAIICTEASNTPEGVTWGTVTGTLKAADAEQRTFYMVPAGTKRNNNYDEYLVINGAWELVGTTKIDLSNYYTKDEVNTLVDAKQDDISLVIQNGILCCKYGN